MLMKRLCQESKLTFVAGAPKAAVDEYQDGLAVD
jgi:hypothetical protein